MKKLDDPTRLVCRCFGAAHGAGLDLPGFDPGVRVQDDLFRAVNGRWLDATEIPADKARYGNFMQLSDLSDGRALPDVLAAAEERLRGK